MGTGSMILDFAVSLGAWAWIGAGLLLLAAEILAPGTFLLWFGLAALATGLLAFAFDALGVTGFGWQAEAVVFLVLALVAVLFGRRYFQRRAAAEPARESDLNHRAHACVGRQAVVIEAVVGGRCRIALDDTTWLASGPDLPIGTEVRVVAAEGSRLVIAPLG